MRCLALLELDLTSAPLGVQSRGLPLGDWPIGQNLTYKKDNFDHKRQGLEVRSRSAGKPCSGGGGVFGL